MRAAGMAAFEKREAAKSAIYAYEKDPEKLDPEYERRFRANEQAWAFFSKQPPGYKRTLIHFVMAAKQDKTRMSRLTKLILASESGKRL